MFIINDEDQRNVWYPVSSPKTERAVIFWHQRFSVMIMFASTNDVEWNPSWWYQFTEKSFPCFLNFLQNHRRKMWLFPVFANVLALRAVKKIWYAPMGVVDSAKRKTTFARQFPRAISGNENPFSTRFHRGFSTVQRGKNTGGNGVQEEIKKAFSRVVQDRTGVSLEG